MLNNRIKLYSSVLLLLACVACQPDYYLPEQPLEQYEKVYMPQAVNNPVAATLKIADTPQYIIYSANFGGQDYPAADIDVTFSVNNALIDSFNTANGTNYLPLPDNSYELSHLTATIPAGGLSTGPLKIAVKTNGPDAMPILRDFLLPISITKAGANVNEELRTVFFVVRAQPELADYPPYDRSTMTIIDFSSEEANGEGPNNGHAIHAFDNNPNSFWHSQWQGASPGPPHHLTVDMGETKTVHGVGLLARQSGHNGKPREVLIQVSEDNVTWTDAGSFTAANTTSQQWTFLPAFVDARYVRLVIESSYGANYVHLAEFQIF
jgi:Domain of unknown function (DUF1735)./F5/8 type C domain.